MFRVGLGRVLVSVFGVGSGSGCVWGVGLGWASGSVQGWFVRFGVGVGWFRVGLGVQRVACGCVGGLLGRSRVGLKAGLGCVCGCFRWVGLGLV